MNKSKFYKIAAMSLLVLNVILVSAFLITKPKGGPGGNNRFDVQYHFKMDEGQHDLFLKNVELHHKDMKLIMEKQKEMLKLYLYNINESQKIEDKEVVMQMMKELEGNKLSSTYNHLKYMKSILREEQLSLFDSFLKHRIEAMSKGGRGRKPHKKK
jgi:NAD+--asparagine ADP-ribosyltransferase